ncbi:hypothetical protein [Ruania zhangjianzhongii]|uniref:hypothetical protein n=1 Tax=Ruania zhangjianzhongii TaxID=2603206 RepID=UPI0011C97BAF|nr:hypothetical protein [Ruania zhangjianzhongii]
MAVALLCAGCTSTGPGGSGEPVDPSGSGPPPSAADGPAAPPGTVPPQLRECGDQEAAPALADLTWTTPDGFEDAGGLTQIAPLEPDYSATYLVPQQPGTGVEVLVVVHYPQVPAELTDDCGEVDRKQVDAYLAQWHEEAGVTATAVQWTEVAGVPAVSERERYQGRDFIVDSTILIGSGELMMISCQWTGQQDVIGAGCEELLTSVSGG